MPSEVRHEVDGGQAYPVLRLIGVLDAASALSIRSCLFTLLSGQPEAIVVDVRQLDIGEPAAVAVLAEAAQEAAAWPGCHLMLCTDPCVAGWSAAGLPIRPAPEDAFAALGPPQPRRFLSMSLEPVLGAARRSRELVT